MENSNRIIKFRAWDKKAKMMLDSEALLMIGLDGKIYDDWIDGVSGNIELMQFTGLTDKNGKEIYEGDILKDTAGNVWEMKWGYEGGHGDYEEKIIGYDISLLNDSEVIGNIYENPELLK